MMNNLTLTAPEAIELAEKNPALWNSISTSCTKITMRRGNRTFHKLSYSLVNQVLMSGVIRFTMAEIAGVDTLR